MNVITCPTRARACKSIRSIKKTGSYRRTSDKKTIQRFHCKACGRNFSQATFDPCVRQKKRQFNQNIEESLASVESIRRIALLLKLNRKTVARKLIFLGLQARKFNYNFRKNLSPVMHWQFDDMETFEHTKLKPLSVTLAVEKKTRVLLAIEVSKMPAKGLLAKKSVKKYGIRKDERQSARKRVFLRMQEITHPECKIESDENPHYSADVREYFPRASYQQYPGGRGSLSGGGELKKLKHDPLFSLNHTCAMIRSNINRFLRKTWCTTKKAQNAEHHLQIYMKFHNTKLLKKRPR
jgi:transposase-like protein